MERCKLLPLVALLCACPGGGVPDDPIIGTEVTNPDLVSDPRELLLDPGCPGGTRRASVLLHNPVPWDIDAAAGGLRGEEAYPSSFEVDRFGSRELVVVIPIPADARGGASGAVQVRHRREGVRDAPDAVLEIPWSAATRAGGPEATVLCGEEIACAQVDFGAIFAGANWQMPLEIANDGCAPLRIERVEAEQGEASVAGPALPATLRPGERWRGRLVLEPTGAGLRSGTVVIATDDAEKPEQRVGWTADVR